MTGCMAEEAVLAEEGCLELMDLLLQGLPLLLGCGIAVAAEEEEDDDDDSGGGGGETEPEVAAEMLVEAPTVTAEVETCSLIPSQESAGEQGHLRPEQRRCRR